MQSLEPNQALKDFLRLCWLGSALKSGVQAKGMCAHDFLLPGLLRGMLVIPCYFYSFAAFLGGLTREEDMDY